MGGRKGEGERERRERGERRRLDALDGQRVTNFRKRGEVRLDCHLCP